MHSVVMTLVQTHAEFPLLILQTKTLRLPVRTALYGNKSAGNPAINQERCARSPVKPHFYCSGIGYQLHQTASDALQFSLCDGDKTISLTASADSSLKLQKVCPSFGCCD